MFKSIVVKKLVDPYIDLGNLLLIDNDPLSSEENTLNIDEDALREITRNNAQYLFNEIWQLPQKNVDQTICAQLPDVKYILPREKPIPKPRQPTKWEAFAKTKGIVKKNRDRKVFDKTTKEWKPRYGYRSAANDKAKKDWLIEIPRQKDPYRNYFEERKQKKQNQKDKYEFQRFKNISRGMKPAELSDANSIPIGQPNNFKQTKKNNNNSNFNNTKTRKMEYKKQTQELTKKIYNAKLATASAGKFQESLKNEKKPKLGIKRKFQTNESNTKVEREHQLEMLNKIQAKKSKPLNIKK